MITRRPSNIVIAVAGLLVFTLILLRGATRPQLGPFSLGNVAAHNLLDNVHNSTLGFEKVFVVGLQARSDRRDGMVLAAALNNVDIEFIDGVLGDKVPDKALPMTQEHDRLPNPSIGSWRGHMNAIQEVVRRNLSSALILEDDADWDVNIRAQLQAFAMSSQALTQPLSGTRSVYADPTYRNPGMGPSSRPPDLSFDRLPKTEMPGDSPYGDHWDALWLGHCGMHFPFEDKSVVPKGRVVQSDSHTVPQQQHLWTLSNPNDLKEQYPNHTRVVHHVQDGTCSLGYAVSRRGARQMLYELGLKDFNAAFDILLRWYCDGESDRGNHNCLTVQPALFQHHRFAGLKSANSDISEHDAGFQDASTDVVRWSVRMNAAAIMDGRPLVDQHPDAE